MYKYFSNIAFLLLFSLVCKAQEDTASTEKSEVKIQPQQHQLRLNVNVSSPVINALVNDAVIKRSSYDFSFDYYLKNEVYAVLDGGWGSSAINYPDLKYNTNNSFARIGVDKCMLQRMFPKDWDMFFIGVRYGIGLIERQQATFTTNDNIWGVTTGFIPAKKLTAHWAELTAGMRVELVKCLFAGYNVRAKFLINDKAFRELPPAYVAGYGKVEKSTAFDFNFYLCYALRWKIKK
jgi:hypothetical protein